MNLLVPIVILAVLIIAVAVVWSRLKYKHPALTDTPNLVEDKNPDQSVQTIEQFAEPQVAQESLEISDRIGIESTDSRTESISADVCDQIVLESAAQSELEKSREEIRGAGVQTVCWKERTRWSIGITLFGDLGESITLLQQGVKLQTRGNQRLWLLNSIEKDLSVLPSDSLHQTAAIGEFPMLFKLSKGDSNRGVGVRKITQGTYLAVAPSEWQRDDSFAGDPPIAPESTIFTGFTAHYFIVRNPDDVIALRNAEGVLFLTKAESTEYQLEGNYLQDTEQAQGPLFGPRLPRILANSRSAMNAASHIRIESQSYNRTEKALDCTIERDTNDLALNLLDTRLPSGAYFARILDKSGDVLCSLPFRLAIGLHQIVCDSYTPAPSEQGHADCHVKFVHDAGCVIRLESSNNIVQLERGSNTTDMKIPPSQNADICNLTYFDCNDGQVKITVRLNRIWWRLRSSDNDTAAWTDSPQQLNSRSVRATSTTFVDFLFPSERWANAVSVGFGNTPMRRYPVKVNLRTAHVPLREFAASEIAAETEPTPLHALIDTDVASYKLVAAQLRISSQCKLCDSVVLDKDDFLTHLVREHAGSLFRPANEHERKKLEPTIPDAIYRCGQCQAEVVVSMSISTEPLRLLQRHFLNGCSNASEDHQEYVVVADRETLLKRLAGICVCLKCGEMFDTAADKQMSEHYFEAHGFECYQIG